jgi:hypothetical protein
MMTIIIIGVFQGRRHIGKTAPILYKKPGGGIYSEKSFFSCFKVGCVMRIQRPGGPGLHHPLYNDDGQQSRLGENDRLRRD